MTPASNEWPPSVPGLGQLLEIGDRRDAQWFLRKYGLLIFLTGLLFAGAGAVYNYFFPPLFHSEARVRFMPPQVAGRFVNPNFSMEVEQRLFALTQLVSSRLIATKLIDGQGLYPERRRFQTVADLTERFGEDLHVTQIHNPDGEKARAVPTLHIRFGYPEPEKAQKVVQKIIEKIYEENSKYRGDQSLGTTEFLSDQLAKAEETMLDAEARLGEIQEQLNATVSPAKLGQSTGRLYVVDSRLRDLRHDQRLLEERRLTKKAEAEQLEQLHKKIETRSSEYYLPEVENHENFWYLRNRMSAARTQVAALREKWAPGYFELNLAEQEAADAERGLQFFHKEQSRALRQRDLEQNASRIALARNELRALETQSATQLSEEQELRVEAQRLREQLNATPGQEAELLSARRDYENAKEQHSALVKKQAESRVASEMERRGQGETVELLEPASLPLSAQKPSSWMRLLMAFLLGLATGALLCLAKVLAAPPVLHGAHLERWAGIPVLASFDRAPQGRPRFLRRAPAMVTLFVFVFFGTGCSDALMGAAGFWAKGNAAEKQGRLGAALLYYRQAIRQDARYGPAYESAANVALRLGELPAAREFLARALEFSPEKASLHRLLADISYQLYFADPGRPMTLLREVESLSDALRQRWPREPDGHRIAAQVLMERHRLDDAIALLRTAVTQVARSENLQAQLAAALFRSGQTAEAEAVLRELLNRHPGYSDAYDVLYLQLMQRQRSEEARAVLAAKHAQTRQLEAALQLAAHDDAQGQGARVKSFLDQLTASASAEALGLARLGDFWLHRSEWARAKDCYERGLKADSGFRAEYAGRLAEWHLAQGKNAEARQWIEAEHKRYPESALIEAYLAAVRLGELPAQRRTEERKRLESILSRMPESPFVRYHLGRAYLLENNTNSAADQFERSIKLDANYAPGWLALAELELTRGNAAVAEQRAESVLQANRGNLNALLIRARAQSRRGKFTEAQRTFEQVMALQPRNTDALFWLAATRAGQGDWTEAQKMFAAGQSEEPANPRWILAQGASLAKGGKLNEARKLLEKAAPSFPNREELDARLAEIQLAMQDGPAAQETFARLAQARPGQLDYQLGLAASLVLAGQNAKALALYGDLQKTHSGDVRVWVQPAALLEEAGQQEAAMLAYEEALKRDKDHPIALNNLAWNLLRRGEQLERALECAQHAKRLLQRAPEVDGTLAAAYLKLSMPRSAAAIYEEMLAYVAETEKPRIRKMLDSARKLSAQPAKGKSA